MIRDGLEKWRNFGRWSISIGGRIRYHDSKSCVSYESTIDILTMIDKSAASTTTAASIL